MSTTSRSERVALLLVVALGALAIPRSARAESPGPPEEPAARAPAPDPMEPLRERFRAGMDHYRAGRTGDAIVVWEQIYRELGSETGYRLSFNLGRAYEAAGDLTKAAEHYETYLAQVEARRARGEALEAQVEKQEHDARERLAQLASTRGRIRVVAGARPTAAQVDNGEPRLAGFVAYVAPGAHTVTFGTGASRTRTTVQVAEGELAEVAPPAPAPEPIVPPPPREPVAGPPRTPSEPFSATWIWVAGGVTLASAVLPLVGYTRALGTKSDFEASSDEGERRRLGSDYEGQRSFAYGTLAVTAGLGAVTAGLGAAWLWWPRALPRATAGADGATLSFASSF